MIQQPYYSECVIYPIPKYTVSIKVETTLPRVWGRALRLVGLLYSHSVCDSDTTPLQMYACPLHESKGQGGSNHRVLTPPFLYSREGR